jgi:hypothetical protein
MGGDPPLHQHWISHLRQDFQTTVLPKMHSDSDFRQKPEGTTTATEITTKRRLRHPIGLYAPLVGVNVVNKRLNVVAVAQSGLFFSHFQARLNFRIRLTSVICELLIEDCLLLPSFGIYLRANPVTDLTVSGSLPDEFQKIVGLETGGAEEFRIEAFQGEVSKVVGVKLAGVMQPNLVNKSRQIEPARHGFFG